MRGEGEDFDFMTVSVFGIFEKNDSTTCCRLSLFYHLVAAHHHRRKFIRPTDPERKLGRALELELKGRVVSLRARLAFVHGAGDQGIFELFGDRKIGRFPFVHVQGYGFVDGGSRRIGLEGDV